MALQSEFKERVLSGTIDKTLWKKVYLSFMRKNGVDIYTDRHAFQVLYALSRHYNVCRVNKTSITWTSRTEHAARANLTIGEIAGETNNNAQDLASKGDKKSRKRPLTPMLEEDNKNNMMNNEQTPIIHAKHMNKFECVFMDDMDDNIVSIDYGNVVIPQKTRLMKHWDNIMKQIKNK